MRERRILQPQPAPTPEHLADKKALRHKLSGEVDWAIGDTDASYQAKVDDYQLERLQSIRSGEPTWLRSNFSSNIGARYDFFRDGRHVGTVIEDEMDCDAFDSNAGPEGPQPVGRRPGMQLDEAVELVEALVKE